MKGGYVKRLPLSVLTALAVILIWIALILFVFLFDLPKIKGELFEQVEHRLRTDLNRGQGEIMHDLVNGNRLAAKYKIILIASEPTTDLALVLDEAFHPILSSRTEYQKMLPSNVLDSVERVVIQEAIHSKAIVMRRHGNFLSGAAPIVVGTQTGSIRNNRLGVMLIRTNLNIMEKALESRIKEHLISHTLLIFILFILLIGGGILLINRPLKHLQSQINTFVFDGRGFKFDHNAPKEIVALGSAFGLMVERWNSAIKGLKDEKIKFESTFEQAAVGIAHVALDGSWLRVNQKLCDIVGYEPSELLNIDFQTITHPEDLETDLEFVSQMLYHERSSYTMRKRYICKNGDIVWVQLTVALVWNDDNTPNFFISVVEDVNDKVKTEEELQSQEQILLYQSRMAAMGEMIGMIAHQWRQPLTVIAMEANTIILNAMMKNITIDETLTNAQKIIDMTQHLSKTIDDFRNFFSSSKIIESALVKSVIENAISLVDKSMEHNAITITRVYRSNPELLMLKRELAQVLVNILNNAKEALIVNNQGHREIRITLEENSEEVSIKIENNGGAIADNVIGRIFEPYFTTKHASNGTGLGLYMSQIIVGKHHGGKLFVSNIENGCIFSIVLPKSKGV